MTIPSQDLKKCTKCKRRKPLSEFYSLMRRGKRDIPAECKQCTIERNQAYYLANHEERKRYHRKHSKEKCAREKNATFAAYGGYICACCGETEKLFLTLDHINNDGAEFRRMISGNQHGAGNTTYRWLCRNGFPGGFQVLCANCQHGKRMNKGICPHKVRCNDYPVKGVGPSGPKRAAPQVGDDIVSPAAKAAEVIN